MLLGLFRQKQAPAPVERRRDPRFLVELEGVAEIGSQRHPVTLSDISASGALVSAAAVLPRGTEIVLRVPELGSLPARIAHCGQGFWGLEFIEASRNRDRVNAWLRSQFGDGAAA